MNSLSQISSEQYLVEPDSFSNSSHLDDNLNRNIVVSGVKGWFSKSLTTIKNICCRNIKKINPNFLMLCSGVQSVGSVAYSSLPLGISSFVTLAVALKLINIHRAEQMAQIERDEYLALLIRDIIINYLQKVDDFVSIRLTEYELLESYAGEVDGNTLSIILKEPIKNLEQVVYYDNQFYDYRTLTLWYCNKNNKNKICPHNRQPLIWDNLLRVDKQNIK